MASSISIPQVPIPTEHHDLFKSACHFVHDYMSQPGHDNSHDWQHILRVLSNAHRILTSEQKLNPSPPYDSSALYLAALLHDIGDRKYAKQNEDTENQISNFLIQNGASTLLAEKVQIIVKNVSYSHETKDPDGVLSTLQKYPELGIVQDADRLDAIGAIGVARCFSFGAAKFPEKPMSRAIDHFEEKLFLLSGMMKTETGKRLAERRHRVLKDFADEFTEEAKLSFEVV